MEQSGTEVEIVRGLGTNDRKYEEKVDFSEMKRPEKQYPKEQIFARRSWIPIYFKLLTPALPILICVLGWQFSEQS